MDTAVLLLGLLACPLGMAAMGGVAWFATKLGRNTASVQREPSESAR